METEFLPLNIERLIQEIQSQDIKRSWLAAEVGVDRNTLRRWLKGDIKKIRRQHLLKIADSLQCQVDSLVLEKPSQLSNSKKQREKSVDTALSSHLRDTLVHSSKLHLADSVLKCTISSSEDKQKQARLYKDLAITSLYQLNLQKSLEYAAIAIEWSQEIGDEATFWETKSIEARVHMQSNVGKGIQGLEEVITASKELSFKNILASALSNVGAAYQLYGNLNKSCQTLLEAIEVLKGQRITNQTGKLAIANMMIAENYLIQNNLENCEEHLAIARSLGQKAGSRMVDQISQAKRIRLLYTKDMVEQAEDIYNSLDKDSLPTEIMLEYMLSYALVLASKGQIQASKETILEALPSLLDSHKTYWLPLYSYVSEQDEAVETLCEELFLSIGSAAWIQRALGLGSYSALAATIFHLPKKHLI